MKAKGGADKRADVIVQERTARVASAYVRGKTLASIAKKEGVTIHTVRRDIDRARLEWRKEQTASYEDHVDKQLARLDAIEAAAWLGWERSLRDELTTGTEDGETPKGPVSKTKVNRKNQSGNASFLRVLNDAVRQRSEILGLTDPDARNASNTDDSMVVSVVIESREEADALQSISLESYKNLIAK
jgi:hypothetical protein